MSASIRLSEKHGVNPTIPVCFFCGEPKDEIVLMGRLKDDKKSPKNVCIDKVPCDRCKKYMEIGVMLISVKDGCTDRENPYRTGNIAVITKEAAKNILGSDDKIAFIDDSAWKKLGLPTE
jgi:hypothetical protein